MANKIALVLLVAIVAYVLYTPQPDYWTDLPLSLRLYISFLRKIRYIPPILQVAGLASAVNVSRTLREPLKWLLQDSGDLGVRTVDETFDTVPVRVYIPLGAQKDGPGIYHIHGGAFILSDVATYDRFCYLLAHSLNAVVVSVEYRRAPEHVFPAALNDCEKALRHFMQHAAQWNVSPLRISLFGDSAGANLAAALALRVRDSPVGLAHPLKFQVLVYPLVQVHNSTMLGMRLNSQDFMLSRSAVPIILYLFGNELPVELQEAGFNNALEVSAAILENNHTYASPHLLERINHLLKPSLYDEIYTAADYEALARLPEEKQVKVSNASMMFTQKDVALSAVFERYLTNPEFAPLLAPSLADLPPAYIVVCEHDMLRDDGLLYAARLKHTNVSAHVRSYEKYHGFALLEPDVPIADLAEFVNNNDSL